MRTVPLGDLVASAQVRRAGEVDYPVLSMTMHTGLVAQADRFKKRIASTDVSDYKIVRRGQLVVGFPINEGVLDFQLAHDAAIVSPAYGIWDLRDEHLVDRLYLKRFLKSPRAMHYYAAKMKGSTARRRSLPSAEFNAMPVPLPSLPEQRRIAAILDHADAIRTKRRQVLAHLDSLTLAVFSSMFASVSETVCLGDLASWRSGGTPPRSEPHLFAGDIPWFSSGELGPLSVSEAAEHLAPEAIDRSAAKIMPARSILVGMYDTAALKSSITSVRAACNQAIAFATIDGTVASTQFVYWAVQHVKPSVLSLRRGIRQKNLNLSMIRAIRIPRVSLDRQEEFERRAVDVAAQRAAVQRALAADDQLFASLQSRAFRGEL